jgi:predicted NUDIX family NTP pyrophosphohydrolase
MGSRTSAGILLYRVRADGLEVLLGHPGGPYFARKWDGHWTIPKGEVEEGEELQAVALREFEEETGHPAVTGEISGLIALGEIVQKGGKRVIAWAVAGDLDPAAASSNRFALEWPPGSGRYLEVPEIDQVAWLSPADARRRIKASQAPFIERLEAALAVSSPERG